MFLDHVFHHFSIPQHTFLHLEKSKHQDHLEHHSQHHLNILGEFLYLESIQFQGVLPTHKEFHLYDYLQSQEKKEEGLR